MPCMDGAYAHEWKSKLGRRTAGDDGGTNQEFRWK